MVIGVNLFGIVVEFGFKVVYYVVVVLFDIVGFVFEREVVVVGEVYVGYGIIWYGGSICLGMGVGMWIGGVGWLCGYWLGRWWWYGERVLVMWLEGGGRVFLF